MAYERSRIIEGRLDELLALIRTGSYATPALAKELCISIPTVSRCIRALRDRGYTIGTQRTAKGWCYFLVEETAVLRDSADVQPRQSRTPR